MNDRFTLRAEWEAYFSLALVNGGYNGVMASMTTRNQGSADLQFDDWSGAGVSPDTSEAMKRIIQGSSRYKKADFDGISDGEVVWRPDDRCMEPGPARGFLAFQKRTCGRISQLLCMGMKKEEKNDPEDDTLSLPTILFTPDGEEKAESENVIISVKPWEWNALCYLIVQMQKESIQQAKSKKRNPSTLSEALNNPEAYFLTTLLAENRARIQSVFE